MYYLVIQILCKTDENEPRQARGDPLDIGKPAW